MNIQSKERHSTEKSISNEANLNNTTQFISRKNSYRDLREAIAELRGEKLTHFEDTISKEDTTQTTTKDLYNIITEYELELRKIFFNILTSVKNISYRTYRNIDKLNDSSSR